MSELPNHCKEKPVPSPSPSQIDTLLSEISEEAATSDPPLITDPKKMRKCPVCGCKLQLFSIDMDRKFLMCENDYCEFPFGYEPLQIVYDQSQLIDNPPPATDDFWQYPPVERPPGHIPYSFNFDMEPSKSSEETSVTKKEVQSEVIIEQSKKLKEAEAREEMKRQKELENIKLANQVKQYLRLTEDLIEVSNRRPTQSKMIRNKKWLANLASFGCGKNGRTFINKDEMKLLKGEEPGQAAEEVVVSIDKMAPIPTIQITKKRKIE